MVDCLIVVNDRRDGVPRPRLALSDGSSWSYIAWLDDVPSPAAAQVIAPAPVVDLAVHMRQAIAEAMPILVHRAQQPVIDTTQQHDPAELERLRSQMRELASAVADAYEALERISADVAEIEQTALADVSIVKG